MRITLHFGIIENQPNHRLSSGCFARMMMSLIDLDAATDSVGEQLRRHDICVSYYRSLDHCPGIINFAFVDSVTCYQFGD